MANRKFIFTRSMWQCSWISIRQKVWFGWKFLFIYSWQFWVYWQKLKEAKNYFRWKNSSVERIFICFFFAFLLFLLLLVHVLTLDESTSLVLLHMSCRCAVSALFIFPQFFLPHHILIIFKEVNILTWRNVFRICVMMLMKISQPSLSLFWNFKYLSNWNIYPIEKFRNFYRKLFNERTLATVWKVPESILAATRKISQFFGLYYRH